MEFLTYRPHRGIQPGRRATRVIAMQIRTAFTLIRPKTWALELDYTCNLKNGEKIRRYIIRCHQLWERKSRLALSETTPLRRADSLFTDLNNWYYVQIHKNLFIYFWRRRDNNILEGNYQNLSTMRMFCEKWKQREKLYLWKGRLV